MAMARAMRMIHTAANTLATNLSTSESTTSEQKTNLAPGAVATEKVFVCNKHKLTNDSWEYFDFSSIGEKGYEPAPGLTSALTSTGEYDPDLPSDDEDETMHSFNVFTQLKFDLERDAITLVDFCLEKLFQDPRLFTGNNKYRLTLLAICIKRCSRADQSFSFSKDPHSLEDAKKKFRDHLKHIDDHLKLKQLVKIMFGKRYNREIINITGSIPKRDNLWSTEGNPLSGGMRKTDLINRINSMITAWFMDTNKYFGVGLALTACINACSNRSIDFCYKLDLKSDGFKKADLKTDGFKKLDGCDVDSTKKAFADHIQYIIDYPSLESGIAYLFYK